MTFLEEFTTYCAICGGPIEDSDVVQGWLSQVILLHRPEPSAFPGDSDVVEFPAKSNGGPYFERLDTRARVTACDISSSIVPSPKPLYIACHKACIFIVKKFLAASASCITDSREQQFRMTMLWTILQKYFEEAAEDKMRPICNIYTAQTYGGIGRFQELVWEPGSVGSELHTESMYFEADPGEIPDLSESILSHLKLLSEGKEQPIQSSDSSVLLPQAHTLDLACTYRSRPSAWREALTKGDYLPWLWDISADAVNAKESSKLPHQEWDWELLVRNLAQVNLHEPRAILPDLPHGLRNRRRIWRLLEDMKTEQSKTGGLRI